MNRKEFLKGMAAVAGSLVVPGPVRAADFGAALQEAAGSGDAAFWLSDAGVHVRELAWADLLDAQQFNPRNVSLVLHAGGEHYVRTIRADRDVERALQRYLAAGTREPKNSFWIDRCKAHCGKCGGLFYFVSGSRQVNAICKE